MCDGCRAGGPQIRAVPLLADNHKPPFDIIYSENLKANHTTCTQTKGVNKLIKYNDIFFLIYILKIYLILVPVYYIKQFLCLINDYKFLFFRGTNNILNKLKALVCQLVDILWSKLYSSEAPKVRSRRCSGWHCCPTARRFRVQISALALMCGICMLSLRTCGLTPGTLVSFRSPKTCFLGDSIGLNWPWV